MVCTLSDFTIIRPHCEIEQVDVLSWIADAHAQSEKKQKDLSENATLAFQKKIEETLFKIGLGKNKILKRGIHIPDILHRSWEKMELYNLKESAIGSLFDKKSLFFDRSVTQIFETFYPEHGLFPSHLIHVTCTGYVAPSPAQKVIAKRGQQVSITHAYHMGCYAAIPSIRIAKGLLNELPHVDIVHSELSSLHMNPSCHSIEQLVVQSLFADGFIKYSVKKEAHIPHFRLAGLSEQIIPNSSSSMSWSCHFWGFNMTLAKDVPLYILNALPHFLEELANCAHMRVEKLIKRSIFAIHPGGPKIIEQIAKKLQLSEEQIRFSREILQSCGNMSSATLPHIWQKILCDPQVRAKETVVSLAFGPGLSLLGAVLIKEG